jgi:hypothetical protein
MTRARQTNLTTDGLTRFEAEDRATAHLANYPADVAFATALMAEFLLAKKWLEEYSEMMQRGDMREVYPISADDFERMQEVRQLVSSEVEVDMIAMHYLRRLLSGLAADERWLAASTVAWRAAQSIVGPRQKLNGVLPEIATAPEPQSSA